MLCAVGLLAAACSGGGVDRSAEAELLAADYEELHAQVRSLTGERDIEVHVCGTHASWRDNTPEDFPDYVDVAVAAPAKVNDYRALGYIVILF